MGGILALMRKRACFRAQSCCSNLVKQFWVTIQQLEKFDQDQRKEINAGGIHPPVRHPDLQCGVPFLHAA